MVVLALPHNFDMQVLGQELVQVRRCEHTA
jgi:hypothetical protein